jgi:ferric-dicitrate binding protein FerR (iron transport regulator)
MNIDYSSYSITDFASDDFFQQWVFTPDEETEKFWQAFLQKYPEKKHTIAEARAILLHLQQDNESPVPAARKAIVWNRIQDELASERAIPVRKNKVIPLWQKIAASVAAVFLVAAGYFYFALSSSPNLYTTSQGEKKLVMLPDSSEVVLNANSSLKLAEAWDSNQSREVWLEGEAYFNIRKKTGFGNARFIVHTKDLKVEVLGTSFNVKTREESTQVVLSEGKVKIDPLGKTASNTIFMAPGESVIISEEKKITKTTVKPELYSAWKSGELILNKTSLGEIGIFVEQTYGLPVVYQNDSLASLVLDGTALPTENRDFLLKAVSAALNIHVEIKKDQIIFKP